MDYGRPHGKAGMETRTDEERDHWGRTQADRDALNRASAERGRERMATTDWQPEYSSWRHGGWYVDNITYPSGAVGCVSRNYPDKKWRVVCAGQDEITYANRDAAAFAERAIALAEWAS